MTRRGRGSTSGDQTRLRGERGAVAIIVAVFCVLAMILLAFVIDRGRVYVIQAQLQNAVDAGALAGVQEFCIPGGDPKGVGEAYANTNSAANAVATIQSGETSYINVRANEQVDLFFGPFVSTDSVTVAVQATASRLCTADFQIVADIFALLNGTGSTGSGIFAGQCFDGGGGSYGIVAVSTDETFDCKTVKSTFKNPPIYPGTGGTVATPLYNTSGVTVPIAAQKAGLNDSASNPKSIAAGEAAAAFSAANGYPKVIQACKDVPTSSMSAGASVNCNGGSGAANKLNVPNGTVAGYLIADGDIVLDNTSVYTGRLIYSRSGNVTLKGDIGAQAIVYAPLGNVDVAGSGTIIKGQIFAKEITFNGGGQGAGDTTKLPAPGPYQLIQ